MALTPLTPDELDHLIHVGRRYGLGDGKFRCPMCGRGITFHSATPIEVDGTPALRVMCQQCGHYMTFDRAFMLAIDV